MLSVSLVNSHVLATMDRQGRGGSRQRAQVRQGAAVQSALTQYLIDRWAWGWISPQTVQAVAHKAKSDIDAVLDVRYVDLQTLSMLASLGTEGAYPNNVSK